MWLALLGTTLALAGDGWKVTAEEGGCVFYAGPQEGEVLPVRADCEWAIPAARMHELLSNNEGAYFSGCAESRVVGKAEGGERVYQRHRFPGITDRAVFLDYVNTAVEGGMRYAWTKSTDQSGLPERYVEIAFDTGHWQVTDAPAGVRVVYELRYLAGGTLPDFVVRWVQGAGTRKVMSELQAYAASGAPP